MLTMLLILYIRNRIWFKSKDFELIQTLTKNVDWNGPEILQDGLPRNISDRVPESVKILSMSSLRKKLMQAQTN